ncbi:MAG: DUF401 family protein [Solobacterium sp.]|nr:DUF401 family protein [Solobacterium sp.]
MNPEVLSLLKMAGLFVFLIVMLMILRKPLNITMAIACVIVIVIYRLPMEWALPAIREGLLGTNTVRAVLVLYFITFLQRMMEKRRQLSGCQLAMSGLFNNRRINASVVPFLLGCLPAASTVILCGPIVREAIGDHLSTNEKAACTTFFRHISEAFLPTYTGIFIAITLTGGRVTAAGFVTAMLPMVAVLFLAGWIVYLRRIPKDTGMVPDQPKSYYLKMLVQSIWPIVVAIAIVLIFNPPVWLAVLIVVVGNFFISKFTPQEIKPFFITAFEPKLILNTLAVMTFSKLLATTGVVQLLPKYFGMLPIPMWLVFALLFFIGPLIGGSQAIYVLCIPMMMETWPTGSVLSVFVLCMSMSYIIMQVAPTHICLTLCAEDYKITLADLIPRVAPMVVVATFFTFGYFFILRSFGL